MSGASVSFFFCPARIPKHAITPLRRRNLFLRSVLSETKDAWPVPLTRALPEIKKVLKPDTFQEFELQEKTVISHNVAM